MCPLTWKQKLRKYCLLTVQAEFLLFCRIHSKLFWSCSDLESWWSLVISRFCLLPQSFSSGSVPPGHVWHLRVLCMGRCCRMCVRSYVCETLRQCRWLRHLQWLVLQSENGLLVSLQGQTCQQVCFERSLNATTTLGLKLTTVRQKLLRWLKNPKNQGWY